jgi:hypothetical protein
MKTKALIFIFLGIILLAACNSTNCPPEPLTNSDIAGYLNGSTGILFTTIIDRDPVLENLNATPFEAEKGVFKMPVFMIDETQIYLLFGVKEVKNPSAFINYQASDYCYNQLFQDFKDELMDIIENDEKNLVDRFVFACGKLAGRLEVNEKTKEKNLNGKEKETIEKLGKIDEEIKELIKDLTERGKKKGEEAKEKLENGDKDGAKQKAEELKEEAQQEFHFGFGYRFCEDWDFGLKYGKFWYSPQPTPVPPELINEFSRDNIRYKVYKSARCGESFTPPSFADCFSLYYINVDSINPLPQPNIWTTEELLPRKKCERGTGFCVEQEVVVKMIREYSDSLCTRLVNVRQVKDFACFD